MIRSVLMGAVAGARSMTPLAAVADAARTGRLPAGNGLGSPLHNPLLASAAVTLAANEWVVDEQPGVPDRTSAQGLVFRVATGAYAGAALAPRRRRRLAALLAGAAAVGSAFATFHLRAAAARRFGATAAAVGEDMLVTMAALLVVHAGREDGLRDGMASATAEADGNRTHQAP